MVPAIQLGFQHQSPMQLSHGLSLTKPPLPSISAEKVLLSLKLNLVRFPTAIFLVPKTPEDLTSTVASVARHPIPPYFLIDFQTVKI